MRRHLFVWFIWLPACSGNSTDPGPDPVPDAGGLINGCELTANTTPTSTVTNGCALLSRDASACEADRKAAGFDGFWLKFSCRVALSTTGADIVLGTDGRPDHLSNYFQVGDPCHDDYQPAAHNPNIIITKTMTMTVPKTPSATGTAMELGAVGLAVNGVALFSNVAAPGDDIYAEALSFDECQGHPSGRFVYHYHSEPYSITVDDSNFVGVMMDGYPVYGRRDADGSIPALDVSGGHTSATPDSATAVYHYHVNQQTSSAPGTAGQSAWFITTGHYMGTPGACVGC